VEIFRVYNVGCTVELGGSFPLKTYLPESDLDVVVLTPLGCEEKDDVKDILQIFSCLCGAIKENEKNMPAFDAEVKLVISPLNF
jgi:tRNA nucleotidyltransferase (CCA-adding enzyme)